MRTVKSSEVRSNWADLLRAVQDGETIVIEHYNRPVAHLTPPSRPDDHLADYARELSGQGRRYAAEIRTGPLSLVAEYHGNLDLTERHLARVLVAVNAGRDGGLLDPRPGENRAGAAERWARAACRGHDIDAVGRKGIEPFVPELDAGRVPTPREQYDTALSAAGIAIERQIWAPGLDQAEAEALCRHLGVEPPAPLVDVDARIAEARTAADEAARARGEDPDDF